MTQHNSPPSPPSSHSQKPQSRRGIPHAQRELKNYKMFRLPPLLGIFLGFAAVSAEGSLSIQSTSTDLLVCQQNGCTAPGEIYYPQAWQTNTFNNMTAEFKGDAHEYAYMVTVSANATYWFSYFLYCSGPPCTFAVGWMNNFETYSCNVSNNGTTFAALIRGGSFLEHYAYWMSEAVGPSTISCVAKLQMVNPTATISAYCFADSILYTPCSPQTMPTTQGITRMRVSYTGPLEPTAAPSVYPSRRPSVKASGGAGLSVQHAVLVVVVLLCWCVL